MLGSVVLVRAAAVKSQGPCVTNPGSFGAASYRWLDRAEDRLHPGKGSA
jgi:hypothetical protein